MSKTFKWRLIQVLRILGIALFLFIFILVVQSFAEVRKNTEAIKQTSDSIKNTGKSVEWLGEQNKILSEQNNKLGKENRELAQQGRNYQRCHAEIFVAYTQTLRPVKITDLDKCETIVSLNSQTGTDSTNQSQPGSDSSQNSQGSQTNTPNNGGSQPPDGGEEPPPPSLAEQIIKDLLNACRQIPIIGEVCS